VAVNGNHCRILRTKHAQTSTEFERSCKSFSSNFKLTNTLPSLTPRPLLLSSTVAGYLWFFFLISLLLFSESESMPQCVKNCNRNFANEAALSRHRKTCSVLEAVHQASHGLRIGRGRGIGPSVQTHPTLLSCKERLQVSSDTNCLGL
jgi:hypothetical protein